MGGGGGGNSGPSTAEKRRWARQDYMSEQQRLDNFVRMLNVADTTETLSGLTPKNYSGLTSARREIANDMEDLGAFNFQPAFSGGGKTFRISDRGFRNARRRLRGAQSDLGALFDQRDAAIAELTGEAPDFEDALGGVELYEEDILQDLLDQAVGGYQDAREYGGNNQAMSLYDTGRDLVQERLDALGERRDEITGSAADFLSGLENRNDITNMDVLGEIESSFEPIQSDIDLFGTDFAQNELDEINAFLENERNRLQSQRESNQARKQLEQNRQLGSGEFATGQGAQQVGGGGTGGTVPFAARANTDEEDRRKLAGSILNRQLRG